MALLNSLEVCLEDGFIYAILAIGYYLTFTILDFPDLSVEGTVLSGGVVFAVLAEMGWNPYLAMILAFIVGCAAGSVTGILHVKLGIRPLLCGILVSTGLITINLVGAVVGNGGSFSGDGALSSVTISRSSPTVYRAIPFNWLPETLGQINLRKLVSFFVMALIVKLLVDAYLKTKSGLLLYATGNNEQFTTMLAKDPGASKILGLALGNGLAALSGALIAQSRGNANQGMGIGMVVIGLASVIIGLSLFRKIRFMKPTTMVILGSVIYQACLSIASLIGVPSAYNKLIMAVLFTIALVLSGKLKTKKSGGVKSA